MKADAFEDAWDERRGSSDGWEFVRRLFGLPFSL